jgi:antitoxin component of RelBE/YafQ-DinJ toxin-antitoxin module
MARIKVRRTKPATMQVRVEDDVKRSLQHYADQQGITLSELIRTKLRDFAADIRSQQQQTGPAV